MARLIADQPGDIRTGTDRFIKNAAHVGIDLSNLWATMSGEPTGQASVRQVCLAVMGSGRTAMMFLSSPFPATARKRLLGGSAADADTSGEVERRAVLEAACEWLRGEPVKAALAQALLEEHERESLAAFVAAGFVQVGRLAYLKKPGASPGRGDLAGGAAIPSGFAARTAADLAAAGASEKELDQMFLCALERSYIETLDCPELCGLRAPEEVLESHRAVGRYDPSLWWVLFAHNQPVGCMLFNMLPELESAELVYLGLAPEARGNGLGRAALRLGLRTLYGLERSPRVVGAGGVTCAVDTRNSPALRLYQAVGFEQTAVRIPVVRGLSDRR